MDLERFDPDTATKDGKMSAQRALAALGLYHGTIDGDWGPKSKAAWRTAQVARLTGPILRTTTLDNAKRAEFLRLWSLATVEPAHLDAVAHDATAIRYNRERYEAVASSTGVPWWLIGLIHGRECSYSFNRHLHNGDPLTARTRLVPAGRPLTGKPPFTWAYSATDALAYDRFTTWRDWSLAGCLHMLERYNGFGYRTRGRQSSYLWNHTNIGIPGKFVADGVFDPAAEDRQPGVCAILKVLVEDRAVSL